MKILDSKVEFVNDGIHYNFDLEEGNRTHKVLMRLNKDGLSFPQEPFADVARMVEMRRVINAYAQEQAAKFKQKLAAIAANLQERGLIDAAPKERPN